MLILILLAVAALAYANGANDNFKGVASLYGSGVCGYKTAISWATSTTAAGSVASVFLATALLEAFSGKGLVPDELTLDSAFVVSVAGGAGGAVLLATRYGFPISTTHSLTGGLFGAALAAVPGSVNYAMLAQTFALPLLLSPLLAFMTGAILYLALKTVRQATGLQEQSCLCFGRKSETFVTSESTALSAKSSSLTVTAGSVNECRQNANAGFIGFDAKRSFDALHFVSAGAVSFARGLNDTPKIAALLLIADYSNVHQPLLLVAIAIATGGLLGARRVARTMSYKLTAMNAGQGFSANLATAALVTTASLHGLPVSTTHVSVGSLLGMGAVSGQAKWKTALPVLASWIVTLPVAAAIACLLALWVRS